MLYLADAIDVSLAPLIGRVSRRISTECDGVIEVTPSYTSILVEADDVEHLEQDVLEIVNQEIQQAEIGDKATGKLIQLPAHYHPEVGPDLQAVAEKSSITINELIHIHASRDYTVCAIGFAPGFAFLAEVDTRIAHPRHEKPRAMVPAGSIGIADQQTAVYPADSPGGWQIIGKCPELLYSPNKNPMCPFAVGDRVRFIPIDRETFIQKGGHV
jgi:KipI family sensor histidine kinase inhibitor